MKVRISITMTLLLGLMTQVMAQIDYDIYPKVTSTYLINDVHIQKSPRDSFGLGDILIEDGYIKQVARQINAPSNALVIEGDSAYVYPAFIDPLSHAGIKKEEDKKDGPRVKFQSHPPNAVVGITPEKHAHAMVDAKNESIKALKSNGFAIANVAPRGSMLPGQSSLMLLSGDSNEDMILKEGTGMYMQLKGTRGYYPTTIIGVMAKWRDLYRQATYLDKHQQATRSSQGPVKRAKADKALTSLIPVTKKEQPVIMRAEKAKDIHKAIALQNDLGYKLILAEVKQAGPALEKIKANRVPVLISAKLPKEEKDNKDKGKKKGDKEKMNEGDKKGKKDMDEMEEMSKEKMKEKGMKKGMKESDLEKEEDPETKALKARKMKSYKEYLGQAAMLEEAGIRFGISMLDSKPSGIKKSLNRMIKAGLSKEAALAAVTTNPAQMLGISDKTGTIGNGKMANLFLSDGPYWDEDSNIKYLFVEGEMTEFEVKKKKKGDGEIDKGAMGLVKGKWSYEVETPMGTFDGTVVITGDEDLAIKIYSSEEPDDPLEGREISFTDSILSYVMDVDMGSASIPATTEVTIDGDSFSGTVTMEGMGSMPISGSKVSGPE